VSERATESAPVAFGDESNACDVLLGRVCAELADRGLLDVRPQ
jgi:hypothetical protein